MKIGIISDIHSNLEALTTCWKEILIIRPDCIIGLGDIIGYGADPNPCMEFVIAQSARILMGNHDYAMINPAITRHFNWLAQQSYYYNVKTLNHDYFQVISSWKSTIEWMNCCFAHACFSNPLSWIYLFQMKEIEEEFRQLPPGKILFIGHTHRPAIISRDKRGQIRIQSCQSLQLNDDYQYIINVGSIGQPRDGNPESCFAIYDTEKRYLEYRRVAYPVQDTAAKIYQQHWLPHSLGERLFYGT